MHLINEVVKLIRLLQEKAVGKVVKLEETIGEYECSEVPQALFESNGSMRNGCMAGWLTAVLKETHLMMAEQFPDFRWEMDPTHFEPVALTVAP